MKGEAWRGVYLGYMSSFGGTYLSSEGNRLAHMEKLTLDQNNRSANCGSYQDKMVGLEWLPPKAMIEVEGVAKIQLLRC